MAVLVRSSIITHLNPLTKPFNHVLGRCPSFVIVINRPRTPIFMMIYEGKHTAIVEDITIVKTYFFI